MYLNKISLVPNLDVINTPKPITGANALSIPLQQKYPFALSYKDDLWGVATIGPKTPLLQSERNYTSIAFLYLSQSGCYWHSAMDFGSESLSMELAILEAKYISIMVVIQFS